MINVQNKSKRAPFVGILVRGADYGDHPACRPARVTKPVAVNLPDGTRGVKYVEDEVPASITLQPGESLAGLPDRVADAPDFRAAVEAGTIAITQKLPT